MQDTENDRQDQEQDHTKLASRSQTTNGQAQGGLHPDQELTYRLKSAIDQRGRYSFRLNDMAAGYAAGRGVSNPLARAEIEHRFTEQLGMSPKDYLDRHYDERREQGHEATATRVKQRENGQGRGR